MSERSLDSRAQRVVLDPELELTATSCRELEVSTTCEDYQLAATETVPDPELEPPVSTVTERIL